MWIRATCIVAVILMPVLFALGQGAQGQSKGKGKGPAAPYVSVPHAQQPFAACLL